MRKQGAIIGEFIVAVPSYIFLLLLMIFLMIMGSYFSLGRVDVFGAGSEQGGGAVMLSSVLFTTFSFEEQVYSVLEWGLVTREREQEMREGEGAARGEIRSLEDERAFILGTHNKEGFAFIDGGRAAFAETLLSQVDSSEPYCFIYYQSENARSDPLTCSDVFGDQAEKVYGETGYLPRNYYLVFKNGEVSHGTCVNLNNYAQDGHLASHRFSVDGLSQPLQVWGYFGRCLYDE